MSSETQTGSSHESSGFPPRATRAELSYDELSTLIASATGLQSLIAAQVAPGQKPNKRLFAGYAVSVDVRGTTKISGSAKTRFHGQLFIAIANQPNPGESDPRGLIDFRYKNVGNNGARNEFIYSIGPDLSQDTTYYRDYVHQKVSPDPATIGREMQPVISDILASSVDQPAISASGPLRWLAERAAEQVVVHSDT